MSDNVISEDRVVGSAAQKSNIAAAKIIAEIVRTTLGPKGMDKMLVDPSGNVVVTNDGVTILREMHIEHPAANMLVQIAQTQEEQVGDGTTTAVVLAGELLKQAEVLLEKNIHPTTIVQGYTLAQEKSLQVLSALSKTVALDDIEMLTNIAKTAMTGKGAESVKDSLATLLVESVLSVKEHLRDRIKIVTQSGSSDAELIKGIVLDKGRVHSNMPVSLEDAQIALINQPLEVKQTEIDAKVSINDPSQLQMFLDAEEKMLKQIVQMIVNSGANVVFCQKGIDDLVQYELAKRGVYACRRVKQSDMQALALATGGKIVTSLKELEMSHLGFSQHVCEKTHDKTEYTYVEGCKDPKAVTLLVRGAAEQVVEETKRALEDALGDLDQVLKQRKVVAGAGACEIELSRQLMQYAQTIGGREQLAIEAYAQSFYILPHTLCENAGLDAIEMITALRKEHESGMLTAGIDIRGGIIDSFEQGIVEPLAVKYYAIQSATQVACMLLRIDDVIASKSE